MPNIEIRWGPGIFNLVYIPYLWCDTEELHLYGGAGSGKSLFAAQKLLMRVLSERGHRFLLARKVANTIRKSQFQLLKDLIRRYDLTALFKIRENDLEIYCEATDSGFVSAGLDDPEKLKSIAGLTGYWVEEATELDKADILQLQLRIRGVECPHYLQGIYTYNPVHHEYIEKAYHENPGKLLADGRGYSNGLVTLLKTTWRDNRFLDKPYKRRLKRLAQQDEAYYQIYEQGNWATPTGLIFRNWRIVSEWPEGIHESVWGLDFGFNVPTALNNVKLIDDELWVRTPVYETHLTNADLIERLKIHVTNRNEPIYADAAEPQRIEEIERAGFNIFPASKAVKPGIDFLKRYRIHVLDEELAREMRGYKWRVDRHGNVLDEPVKFNDHAIDALRYPVYTHGSEYWTEADAEPLIIVASTMPRKPSITAGF